MPSGVKLTEEEFVKESISLIEKAQKENIILRILGGLAIYIHSHHCPRCQELHRTLGRLEGEFVFTDLDLIGYKKQLKGIKNFFEKKLGFKRDFYVNALFGGKRLIYYHPENYYYADIFLSKLEFSHNVYFSDKHGEDRLELDYPTITLSDLVLEKLQIHDINKKDIIDLIVLFHGHDITDHDDKEYVNGKYISRIFADDWGFWYDATNNLKLVIEYTVKFQEDGKINSDEKEIITSRVEKLLKYIDNEPKTKNWQKRAKVGANKPWYRPVEEVFR